jgi:hypothetical protein
MYSVNGGSKHLRCSFIYDHEVNRGNEERLFASQSYSHDIMRLPLALVFRSVLSLSRRWLDGLRVS